MAWYAVIHVFVLFWWLKLEAVPRSEWGCVCGCFFFCLYARIHVYVNIKCCPPVRHLHANFTGLMSLHHEDYCRRNMRKWMKEALCWQLCLVSRRLWICMTVTFFGACMMSHTMWDKTKRRLNRHIQYPLSDLQEIQTGWNPIRCSNFFYFFFISEMATSCHTMQSNAQFVLEAAGPVVHAVCVCVIVTWGFLSFSPASITSQHLLRVLSVREAIACTGPSFLSPSFKMTHWSVHICSHTVQWCTWWIGRLCLRWGWKSLEAC